MGIRESRVDYLKFIRTITVREGVEQKAEWARLLQHHAAEIPYNGEVFYNPISGQDGAGFQRHMVDIAGATADTFAQYLTQADWKHLKRIDYRIEIDVNDENFREWRAAKAVAEDTKRNYNAYNTKVRNKTDARDRGGFGIAFGSLKSALRINFYQEKKGKLAIEISFKGDYAHEVGESIEWVYRGNRGTELFRNGMMQVLRQHVDEHFTRVMKMSLDEYINMVAADDPIDIDEMHREQRLFDAEVAFKRLTKAEKQALVQGYLFGDLPILGG